MKDRVREFLDLYDLKSFGVTSVVLLLLIFTIYKCAYSGEKIEIEKCRGKANAMVTSVKPNVSATQGRYGARVNTDSYDVTYQYKVNQTVYHGLDNVKNIGRNELLIQRITKVPLDSVEIMFQFDNPEKSIIKR